MKFIEHSIGTCENCGRTSAPRMQTEEGLWCENCAVHARNLLAKEAADDGTDTTPDLGEP